jgi:hypothetical protein
MPLVCRISEPVGGAAHASLPVAISMTTSAAASATAS